jgi:hypothetical protein
LSEFVGPGIELVDERTNGDALLEEKCCDYASG